MADYLRVVPESPASVHGSREVCNNEMAGLSCLNPIETKAGMDLVELKREYGRDLAFFGGIDVRAMADPDPRVIEDEIKRKLEVAMVGGGYIYHSDHSVPNNVSFQQYCRVIELVRKYGVYG